MQLEKAIERMETWHRAASKRQNPEDFVAMRLLIEAGKRLNKMRQGMAEPIYYLLPGETEE